MEWPNAVVFNPSVPWAGSLSWVVVGSRDHAFDQIHHMKPQEKKKAVIGIPIGLVLFGGGLLLSVRDLIPIPLRLLMVVGGVGIYIWGCLALAKAKGYSSAIVLTVVLGVLFPAVVLLALEDKNKNYERRR